MTNTGLEKGFAGLPTSSPQGSGVMTAGTLAGATQGSHLPPHKAKPFQKFTLPSSIVGSAWAKSDFSDDDLTFGMTEITTAQRLRASNWQAEPRWTSRQSRLSRRTSAST